MKDRLAVNNLVATHWDSASDTYQLDFRLTNLDGVILLVTISNAEAMGDVDEFYWDNDENVNRVISMADADDIEIFKEG